MRGPYHGAATDARQIPSAELRIDLCAEQTFFRRRADSKLRDAGVCPAGAEGALRCAGACPQLFGCVSAPRRSMSADVRGWFCALQTAFEALREEICGAQDLLRASEHTF